MKKNFLSILAIVLVGGLFFITSCTPEDMGKPVVTLTGDAVMTIDFGATFTDPGATATDDVDDAVTVIVTGEVNKNAAGEYTLTYTATDEAGNVGTAERTVYVSHRKGNIVATYTASEQCTGPGGPYTVNPYSASITPGAATNMAIIFNNFGNFTVPVNVNGTLAGNAGLTLTIPQQTNGLTFEGSGTINAAGTVITITYTAADGGATDTCTATWTKQ
ncbi:MAG: DUF5011 domain-containing protein [Bacteroidales bacterium]|nr:DUF5011 domain-containing protein [Bacteroidales bacterium]